MAISYDAVPLLKKFAARRDITFPLLSDEGSKTIDAYGIRNHEPLRNPRWEGIPHPGTFIVDQKGIIRAKLFYDNYKVRHDTEELLEALKKLQ